MTRIVATQQWILGVTVVAAVLVVDRASLDVFTTVKATVVGVGVVCSVGVAVAAGITQGRLSVPAGPLAWTVAAFSVAVLGATLVSSSPLHSVVGRVGRHTGAVLYLAVAWMILATAWTVTRRGSARWVGTTILVAAVPPLLYGLLQAIGADPFAWATPEGGRPVFATFGNTNFLSGWLGTVVPVAATWVAGAAPSPRGRIAAGLIGVLAVVVIVASGSAQGVVGAAAGVALVAGVLAHRRWGGRQALAVVVVPVAVAAAIFAVGPGSVGAVRADVLRGIETRAPKWSAALDMAADRPLSGFGLDTYGEWFFAYRDPATAADSGLDRSVDNPHSVPLAMLQSGGLPLLAAWLALVGTTGWALVTGLRRQTDAPSGRLRNTSPVTGIDPNRLARPTRSYDVMAVAGLGGAWVAYLTQALVSIDVPVLALQHAVLAGALMGVGGVAEFRTLRVARPAHGPAHRPTVGRTAVAVGCLVLLGMTVVAALRPWRADRAAYAASTAVDAASAQQTWADARRLAPWEAAYPGRQGVALDAAGRPGEALAAFQAARQLQPRGLDHVLNAARLQVRTGASESAADTYADALVIDPHTPTVLAEVARNHLRVGRPEAAAVLLERAVQTDPDTREYQDLLTLARIQASS